MNKQPEFKFQEYDINLLKEARHRIDMVRNYSRDKPHSGGAVRRLETLMYKIDDLLEEET